MGSPSFDQSLIVNNTLLCGASVFILGGWNDLFFWATAVLVLLLACVQGLLGLARGAADRFAQCQKEEDGEQRSRDAPSRSEYHAFGKPKKSRRKSSRERSVGKNESSQPSSGDLIDLGSVTDKASNDTAKDRNRAPSDLT